ncbi:branched-chain amino acid transport system ATP-binding protein [Paraburkholderia sp. WC7.3g]|uniref:ABC transporter ATP-binding protein n=1 Tax=Paraburkholderia podalyriae TaxID=1938811 RepID=A0ABR7PI69_9BURK|nr:MULTISPECIES: ABC transporter ATP-binding protein [Paraburkholderia]MBB5406388.1 branched-chain amino acid transport system ATP-binding protein [Paraburkholderia sp. HC6.4b]MBB5448786.1 branched-chain amino acid transport system ATP-binding protein [Paraburkholderia sp. Kb1A]MBC8745990.1 ABC transporter ATP-binding protein [Paraburkholderia podalyriae]
MSAVLEASNLCKSFGDFTAVDGVSLTVHTGEAVAIIGPNGAGKSSLFDLLTGRKMPDAGEIHLFGKPVTRQPPWRRVKQGLGRSFQLSSLFPAYSARENVQVALMAANSLSWNVFLLATKTLRAEADDLLDRVGLSAKAHVRAGELSHGDLRTLDLAVALATRPKVLLLDEPTAGMGREESRECLAQIRAITRREKIPIAFVEHDMDVVFSFATRVIVLVAGKVLIDAPPERVRADERVKEAYFGEDF